MFTSYPWNLLLFMHAVRIENVHRDVSWSDGRLSSESRKQFAFAFSDHIAIISWAPDNHIISDVITGRQLDIKIERM